MTTLVTLITSQEERRAQAAQDEASHELKADDVQVNLQIIIFISLNMIIIISLVWNSSLSLNMMFMKFSQEDPAPVPVKVELAPKKQQVQWVGRGDNYDTDDTFIRGVY